MRNRVNIADPFFKVDEEKKVVVCVLKCDMQLKKHPSWDLIYPYMWNNISEVDCYGKFQVVGIARCNADDVFNPEVGKKIAESRAKGKAFKLAGRVYDSIVNKITSMAEDIVVTLNACDVALETEKQHVEKLIETC